MRVEVPKFRRCCFCIPLRRGLLTWAYVSLACQVLMFLEFVRILYEIVYERELLRIKYVIATVCLIFALIFAVYNGLIIVASHKKSTKLLNVSYIYGMVLCALWSVNVAYKLYSDIIHIHILKTEGSPKFVDLILDTAIFQASVFFELVLQGYLILLLRSELLKLRDQSMEVQFMNNAAESEARFVNAHRSTDNDSAEVRGIIA